ncbi:siroheme synthase CysG [Aquabacter cavernae]|uniref:siroheme synthase CysG n=1 Tax=Aquabacter cavernae TaxID=2496029 RepID=UPI001FDEA6DD|nr:siroheme synthase CysG [Aquabacter cavernae]
MAPPADKPNTPRAPREKHGGRMEPLARLPVFFALAGKKVVVAGGDAPAVWKAELLSAAGAHVDVLAAAPCAEMTELAAEAPGGPVTLVRRGWEAGDLAGAALAICDAQDDAEAARFAEAARAAGVPVNVVDRPAFCDFAFGAIVNRSPLVVGISTDGAAPVFGQAIRAKIEAILPKGFRRWAQAAQDWRASVTALGLSFQARRAFWEAFAVRAMAEPEREPGEGDRRALFDAMEAARATPATGSVVLVGAGPGDPELLTLKAVRALQSAEVVLYDDLVSPQVLDFARREARKMLVGKTGYGPSCKQDDINALMVRFAKEGRRVVRLKGGDPMIFGRAGEEITACRAAGIPVEVVPGISSPQGVAAGLVTSLTHRDHARRLQFVTAHARDGKLPKDLDFKALADPAATTVVYMPRRTLGELVGRLAGAGIDPSVPALAVFSATRPDQVVVSAPLGRLAEEVARAVDEGAKGPCLVLYGHALSEGAGAMALAEAVSASAG